MLTVIKQTVINTHYILVCTISPVNIQMDPPQIATDGFSSDSLSERSPEQHTKNRGKSRRANIIFFGKIQNGSQKRNCVYYSVILNTKM